MTLNLDTPTVEAEIAPPGYTGQAGAAPDILAPSLAHRGAVELDENPEGPDALPTFDAGGLDRLGALFKLLSDRTRLTILQLLGHGEMNVSALCRRLSLPQPTVSHHLGLLRMNRLIENRRSGKQVFYQLDGRVTPLPAAESDDESDDVEFEEADAPLLKPAGLRIVNGGFAVEIALYDDEELQLASTISEAEAVPNA